MTVPEHIEHYLGKITHGIKSNNSNGVNAVIFPSVPENALTTYVTLGLSKYDLNYKSKFELVFVSSDKEEQGNLANMLIWIADLIIQKSRPVLCGEIVYLPQTISKNTKMNCLLVYTPFYFEDNFQVAKTQNGNVVFPLLIPIYIEEAKLIQEKGIESFENFLSSIQANNLWYMNRTCFSW